MTNYSRGRSLESRVKRDYETRGYFVVRSAGSKGAADLVAIRAGEPTILIQCKIGRCSQSEREALEDLAASVGAKAEVVERLKPKVKPKTKRRSAL